MKTLQPFISRISFAAVLAGGLAVTYGAAPVAGGATGAVNTVAGGLPVIGGNPAAAAGAHATTGALGTTTGADTSSNAGQSGPVFDTSESIGMRQERRSAQSGTATDMNAKATPETDVVKVKAGVAPGVWTSAALDAGPTAAQVRTATLETRGDMLAKINSRVEAGDKAMVELKAQAKKNDTAAQTEFRKAARDVGTSEKELKKSLETAQSASAEAWPDSRATLANNYEVYAASVTHAEAVASARPTPTTSLQPGGAAAADAAADSTTSAHSDANTTKSK